jgi:hypothetical protein
MAELTEKDFTFKTKPLKHQVEALCRSAGKANFAYLMEMGCVDGETEFLTNRGWIKFKDFVLSEWEEPLYVGQVSDSVMPNSETHKIFSFVKPTNYIKKKTNKMYHFTGVVPGSTKPCLDIMVTPEHNMRCRLIRNTRAAGTIVDVATDCDVTAEELAEHIAERTELTPTFQGKAGHIMQRCWISEDLSYENNSALSKLNQWELRVLVAVMADGSFPHKEGNRCVVEFSKQKKIDRFTMLCRKAGILAVRENIRGGKSVRFNLISPLRKKIYDEEFWMLSPRQQSIIFHEVCYWDGSREANKNRFYTIHKSSADFVQFLAATHGYRATLVVGTSNDKPYYTVEYNPKHHITDTAEHQCFTTVIKYQEVDETQWAYCFRVPSGQLLLRRDNKIFVTGNSGKTKVIIDNMTYLKQKGAITAAIVLAPKGVYRNWSTQEIPKHMPDEVNPQILVWKADASAGYKKKLLDDIERYDGNTFPIMVFNIESLLSANGMATLKSFLKKHKGTVMGVIDESTCIKNHKAKRTKAALEIGSKCRVRRIATGSPITNSPLDLYSQFAFLDKQIIGCGSFYAFRNIFAEIERITTRQGQSFDKILKYKNLHLLSKRINDFSFRVTKKECLDLPEKVYITRDVELTPEQKRLYKEMKNLSFTMLDDEIMSVQVALTKLLRLHQILCGSFTTDDGEIQQIPNNRIEALSEVLDETSGKAIIWANYLQNIEDIKQLLTEKYGPESFVVYTGATGNDDRVEAIKMFQNANSPVRFFLGNVQTAGRGITLTAAQTVIYFSNNYSLEMRQQSEDRAHRVGQTNNVTYVDLVVRDSLDEKIIQALLAKRNIANEILHDDLEDWIQL